MKLFLFASTDESTRQEGGLNSVLAIGEDEDAACEAVCTAAESTGGFNTDKLGRWPAFEIADGDVTLPGSKAVLFLGRAYAPLNPLPGQ